jgi:methylmalonyl-CoA mutase C-terminal domain/subunit
VPKDDVKKLKELGVKEIFLPGSPTTEIVDWIRKNVPVRA